MSARDELIMALVEESMSKVRLPDDATPARTAEHRDVTAAKHEARWTVLVGLLARHVAEVEAWVQEVKLEQAAREERDRVEAMWGTFVIEIREDYAHAVGSRANEDVPDSSPRPAEDDADLEAVPERPPTRVVSLPVPLPAEPIAPSVVDDGAVPTGPPGPGWRPHYRGGHERRLVAGAAFLAAGIFLAVVAVLIYS